MVRLRCSDDLEGRVARCLTKRDRFICEMLYEHRVLTTDQVCDLAFDNRTTARHRLALLWQLRLVDRFRPHRDQGSAPAHYVLDELGAVVVAAARGLEREELLWRRDRMLAIATSQRLPHLLGVNHVFCALAGTARRRPDAHRPDAHRPDADRPDAHLLEWWSERRCLAHWDGVVRPDGYGRWRQAGNEVSFFLEYDRGTERLARLAAKLDAYTELALSGEQVLVLFAFESGGRETEARVVLRSAEVSVATAVVGPVTAPDGRIWAPIGGAGRRRLAELEGVTTATNRGVAVADATVPGERGPRCKSDL